MITLKRSLVVAAAAVAAAGLVACGSSTSGEGQATGNAAAPSGQVGSAAVEIPGEVNYRDMVSASGERIDEDKTIVVVRPATSIPSWLVGVKAGDRPDVFEADESAPRQGCRDGLELGEVTSATGGAASGRFYHFTHDSLGEGILFEFDIISSELGPEGVLIGVSPTESKAFSIVPQRLEDLDESDNHHQRVVVFASDIGSNFDEVTTADSIMVVCGQG